MLLQVRLSSFLPPVLVCLAWYLTYHLFPTAHPSPPPTPPRMRTHRGHRHTQSLFVTPSRPNTGLQTPPNSRSKTYPTSNPYFLTTTPTRCKPTLAMSVHIHSPAPREPSPHHQRRAYSPRPASPTLRRNSSQQEHVPRPPSRSERLLRDTLMRDELERNNSYVPPLPSSPRRPSQSRLPSYESSGAGGCLTDDTDDAAADPWSTRGSFLFRTTANGSSAAAAAGLVRNRSMSHVRQQSISHPPPQGRCTSPTPSRHNLQRSANSMPTAIPLSSSTTTTTSSRSRSHSHSHSPSISSFPPAGASPHEAVLRSRLEKVLSMGREEQRLQQQQHQHQQEGPAVGEVGIGSDLLLHRSQPHYQRTGKRRSGENSEWLWSSQDVCFFFSFIPTLSSR
ncbi:hypothetical protein PILCRDRAFT_444651 [Piloderma croceum F 1598]|uniref:Uncharacterized protein n=1 Tax=Piloderma croceum (strain F 1598) TaxID=765440 RepID=A0A0C3FGE7_PILCF|nr:hypothetical protein PILCRDRAFT_444651 [Piloderma croceum F 1598]